MSRVRMERQLARLLRCVLVVGLACPMARAAPVEADLAFKRIDDLAQALLRYDGDSRDALLAALDKQFSFSCEPVGSGAERACEVRDAGMLRGFSYTREPFRNLDGKRLVFRLEFRLAANCHASLPQAWGELAQGWHQQIVTGMHGIEASRELVQSNGRRRAVLSGVFGRQASCPETVGMEAVFVSIVSEGD